MAGLLDRGFDGTMIAQAPTQKAKNARVALAQARLDHAKGKPVKTTRISLAEAAGLNTESQGDTAGNRRPQNGSVILAAAGGWGVQVGAFQRYVQAQLAAARAINALPEDVRSAVVMLVQPIETNAGMLYRARIAGMTKDAADDSCRILVGKQFDCNALAIGPSEVAENLGSN
jgi:D-alanyl-D-alanine carboxypeptidase